MTNLTPQFREATPADAEAMAELVNIAGDGLPLHLWATFARPGQTAADVGRERAREGLGGFAFGNTVVSLIDNEPAACLIGYPLDRAPQPPSGDAPAMLAPLLELQRLTSNAWFLNVLATFPAFRGRGLASELLAIAERRARAAQCGEIALTMSESNATARRLYERAGFAARATRAIVKGGWQHAGERWVLMVKDLRGA